MKPAKIDNGHLEHQRKEIGDDVMEAVKEMLPTGKYTPDPQLKEF